MNNECCPHRGIILSFSILGLCLIIAAGIAGFTFYKVKSWDNSLSVIGSTKKQITSDRAKWILSFSKNALEMDMKSAYVEMNKNLQIATKFFNDAGVETKNLVISPILSNQNYYYNEKQAGMPKEYNLRQTVEIQSSDVEKITKLAKDTQKLIDQGVLVSTDSLEYYYSKLPELRVSLLGEAVKDATSRAEKIASSSGKQVGVLKDASIGVVQVLPVNSVEVSDYGAYDTSHIEKEVMVTVRASFMMK